MSTHSAIGIKGSDQFHYVHWDGDSVGDGLKAILDRDGKAALDILLVPGRSWSSVESRPEMTEKYGTQVKVPGYGDHHDETMEAMTLRQARDYRDIQFVWEIDPDTLEVKDVK